MVTFSKEPLSVVQIWGDSIKLYKKTIAKVWLLSFITMFITNIPGLLLGKEVTQQPQAHITAGVVTLLIIIILLTWFLTAVILHRMHNHIVNPTAALGSSVGVVLSKYLIIIVASIITSIVSTAGFLLFIIPGVFFAVFFFFAMPLILFDNQGAFAAIKNCFKLVWGNWWQSLGAFILPMAVIIIVELTLNHVAKGTIDIWSMAIIDALLLSILYPWLQTTILVQYHNLQLENRI